MTDHIVTYLDKSLGPAQMENDLPGMESTFVESTHVWGGLYIPERK